MGDRGPKKTPLAILKARGSREVSRREKHAVSATPMEAKPPQLPHTPTMDEAMAVVCDCVNRAGTGGEGHEIALLRFAQAVHDCALSGDRWREWVQLHPAAQSTVADVAVERALRLTYNESQKQVDGWIARFGVDPASVGNIAIPSKPPKQVEGEPKKAPLRRGL